MDKKECQYCYNTGYQYVPNGPDDYETDFCYCPIGRKKLKQAETNYKKKCKKKTKKS